MNKLRINKANEVLLENLNQIRTVSEWAELMGWERSDFSRTYSRQHSVTAKQKLNTEKLRLIERLFGEDPYAKSYEIACETGFKDEKALYDYLRYHNQGNTSSFRRQFTSHHPYT
jgi:transcriptional regulator GlxA family with amidase domain